MIQGKVRLYHAWLSYINSTSHISVYVASCVCFSPVINTKVFTVAKVNP